MAPPPQGTTVAPQPWPGAPAQPGGPVPQPWNGPGGFYGPLPVAKRQTWLTAAGLVGGILVTAVLVGVVMPAINRQAPSGVSLFAGGVPSEWGPARVNVASDTVLVSAWETPGASVNGFFPCVFVVRYKVRPGVLPSAPEWFAQISALASQHGRTATHVVLDNGAPAMSEYLPFAQGTNVYGAAVQIGAYEIYAKHGTGFYRVEFMATEPEFSVEEPSVARVMMSFEGSVS
ncbi:MAG TPA: hypothetical protein VFN61_08210 [Acidimicrobiales bacterium]|nr:hypothetical protein [Acidimicrobiales bacterium]